MIIVDEASTRDKIELVFVFLWEVLWVAKLVLVKLFIGTFVGGLIKHVRTDITSVNIFESLITQIFTDQTSATRHIKDLDIGWVPLVFFGKLRAVVGNEFWVGVSQSGVHALIVGSEEVKVDLRVLFCIFVAGIIHFLMLLSQVRH